MKNALIVGAAGIAISAAMLGSGFLAGQRMQPAISPQPAAAAAEPAASTGIGASDREQIGAIVRDYLLANPELLAEVQQALETKQAQEQKLAQVETIARSRDTLLNASYDGVFGNPDGQTTVVEFFDYNCSFCKRAMSDMEQMAEADPDVRFILKEFPILGPDSQKAHIVSMAFRALMPDQYGAFHTQLLGGAGRADEATAIGIALSLGADEAALRKEMQNPAIMQAFGETYELANALQITGTPSYVVGDEVVFGALGRALLEEKVANIRQCGTATC